MLLRNRFLNTASFLSAPNDLPSDGKKPVGEVVGSVEETGDDDVGGDDQDAGEVGDGGAIAGGDEDPDGAGDDDDPDEDDDPDLAGFTPEQRKKIQAKIDKETRWRDRQLERTHAKRRSAEEDVRAAAAINAGVKPGENLTDEQIEERARVLAGQLSAQERYDNASNETHANGLKAYGDKWNKTLAKLPKLGGLDKPDMDDILATDHPEVVLFSLSDPDTYDRVMTLPPAKRRTEIIKLGMKEPPKRAKAGDKESKRPGDVTAPVRPVNGGRQVAAQSVNLYDPNLQDDDAWYAARNATRRKKFSDVA